MIKLLASSNLQSGITWQTHTT